MTRVQPDIEEESGIPRLEVLCALQRLFLNATPAFTTTRHEMSTSVPARLVVTMGLSCP
jgi:hypothetical protein